MSIERVGIVGAGLIGTSLGLALARTGASAVLVDEVAGRAEAAAALGAGQAGEWGALAACDHVVVAVPPKFTVSAIERAAALAIDATLSDVTSVKSHVLGEIEQIPLLAARFCGGHPIAGRERHGPGAAQPELFDNAVWVVTPGPTTTPAAQADVTALAERCGARPIVMSAGEHDAVLAVVSHTPQLLASLLAGELPLAGPYGPILAGAGFRDMTRLADSDATLWADIATANRGELAPVLARLARRLDAVASSVAQSRAAEVSDMVAAGNRAREALPAKSRNPRPDWARVGVVLADRPGELALLLAAAGDAGVNVEDLTIEHAPDHPAGFVDLEVAPEAVPTLIGALTSAGWAAHRTR